MGEVVDLHDLIKAGGPETLAQKAAEEAARKERQRWLKTLSEWLKVYKDNDYTLRRLRQYIDSLRRKLGIRQSAKVKRTQTRERVRRFRERQREQIEDGEEDSALPLVRTKADFDALTTGQSFVGRDGKVHTR
jgi:hypothetical protein